MIICTTLPHLSTDCGCLRFRGPCRVQGPREAWSKLLQGLRNFPQTTEWRSSNDNASGQRKWWGIHLCFVTELNSIQLEEKVHKRTAADGTRCTTCCVLGSLWGVSPHLEVSWSILTVWQSSHFPATLICLIPSITPEAHLAKNTTVKRCQRSCSIPGALCLVHLRWNIL